jgi:hypothetical protein
MDPTLVTNQKVNLRLDRHCTILVLDQLLDRVHFRQANSGSTWCLHLMVVYFKKEEWKKRKKEEWKKRFLLFRVKNIIVTIFIIIFRILYFQLTQRSNIQCTLLKAMQLVTIQGET